MDFAALLPIFGTFVLVAVALAGVGKAINGVIWPEGIPAKAKGSTGWRYWWRRSMPLHPLVAGALVGALTGHVWPLPEFVGATRTAAAIYFCVAGILSLPVHARVSEFVAGDDD